MASPAESEGTSVILLYFWYRGSKTPAPCLVLEIAPTVISWLQAYLASTTAGSISACSGHASSVNAFVW